ncbi:MAG: peptide chain release factor 1 [Gemmatimonadota bacterium]|jgi:peptide chain release factor 1
MSEDALAVDPRLLKRLQEVQERFREVDLRLTDPDVLQDPDRLRELGRERAHLEEAVRLGGDLQKSMEDAREAREILEGSEDETLRDMAREELDGLQSAVPELAEAVRELLIPRDPLDDRPAVVEIRAGTGGDEAGLFAADLLRMYQRYAEKMGWSVELLDASEGIPGAFKEVIFTVRGEGAYGRLRLESGVHRVQRVPETESQGRIHTSAASVAVLPEAEEVDVEIDPNDLRIDVFRSSGPGGQSVNTTDSAVRITHVPTGLVVSCQDEKSQHKNKAKALKVLRSRLLDRRLAEQKSARAADRRSQIGSGDRSAKIRTYNFPQGRVTDHRIGLSVYDLDGVLGGELAPFVRALRLAEQEERMEEGSE